MLNAVQLAYRKHHMGDSDIGWEELSNELHIALCFVMGDDGYQQWSDDIKKLWEQHSDQMIHKE